MRMPQRNTNDASVFCVAFELIVSHIYIYMYFQADEEERDFLHIKIQTAISALNDPLSPMSI